MSELRIPGLEQIKEWSEQDLQVHLHESIMCVQAIERVIDNIVTEMHFRKSRFPKSYVDFIDPEFEGYHE